MRVLIAKDDQVLADGLLRALRNAGYAVDQVGCGTAADAALASHDFDCVILVLGLPKLCRWKTLARALPRPSASRCSSRFTARSARMSTARAWAWRSCERSHSGTALKSR